MRVVEPFQQRGRQKSFILRVMQYLVRLMVSSGAIQRQKCKANGHNECVRMHQNLGLVHVHAPRLYRLEFSNPGASDAPIQFCGLQVHGREPTSPQDPQMKALF